MNIEEAFKKREEDFRQFAEKTGNPVFLQYGVLSDRIAKQMLDYLHAESPGAEVDKESVTGVLFSLSLTLARFACAFDNATGRDISSMLGDIVKLCVDSCKATKEMSDKMKELAYGKGRAQEVDA